MISGWPIHCLFKSNQLWPTFVSASAMDMHYAAYPCIHYRKLLQAVSMSLPPGSTHLQPASESSFDITTAGQFGFRPDSIPIASAGEAA